MEINRGIGVALWRQIQTVLEDEIGNGTFAPGEKLPTEQKLAARFGVNRHTIRRALGRLADRGLVRVEQGRGTFVQENVIEYPLGKRTRFSENLSRQKRLPGGTMINSGRIVADKEVARALEIEEASPVVLLVTAGEADGQPISLSSHYFPTPRFDGFESIYKATGSITEALHHYGVKDYLRKRTRIIARMPTSAEARKLRMPRNRPVLVTESVNIDSNGMPIEYGVTLFCSDWVQLVVDPQ